MTSPTREEIDAKLKTMEVRIEGSVASLEANMKAGFAELRADMHKLSADMHKQSVEVVKWIVGTALAMFAAAITVTTFVLNNSAPKPQVTQVPHHRDLTGAARTRRQPRDRPDITSQA